MTKTEDKITDLGKALFEKLGIENNEKNRKLILEFITLNYTHWKKCLFELLENELE